MKLSLCVLVAFAACMVLLHEGACEEKKASWMDKWKGKLDALKKKMEGRQIEAKKIFDKIKKKMSEFDNVVGKNTMRVDKKGGKLMIQRKGQFLAMKIKEIVEKYENGTVKMVTPLKGVTFTVSKTQNSTDYGGKSVMVEMTATLNNTGTVTLKMYMFREAVNITGEDDNVYEILEGGTKANFVIDWPHETKHLDLVIAARCGMAGKKLARKAMKELKARAKKGGNLPANARSPMTMSVCPNARMTLSPRFKKNDLTWEQMPEDYPKTEEVTPEGDSIMVVNFKGKKIFYDPISETGDDIGDGIDGGDTSAAHYSKIPNAFLTFSMAAILSVVKMMF